MQPIITSMSLCYDSSTMFGCKGLDMLAVTKDGKSHKMTRWKKEGWMSPGKQPCLIFLPVCQQQTEQTRTVEPRGTEHADCHCHQLTHRANKPQDIFDAWYGQYIIPILLNGTSHHNTNCCLQICTTPSSCLPRLGHTANCIITLPLQVQFSFSQTENALKFLVKSNRQITYQVFQ